MDLYKDKTALITGASSGIGAAFAKALAAAGTHLILVARSEEKLRILASQLATQYAIRAEVIVADLSGVEAAHTVFEETQQRGLTVDILINNAGFGTYGPFETLDAEREQEEIRLNVATLVDLTHAFLPAMLARRQGAIINVASLAAFQPIPHMAVYAASKAFVLSFSEALWGEYRTKGVRVLALSPGETATEFFRDLGNGYDAPTGNVETPEQVVQVGLRALEQGRSSVVSGRQNALTVNASRFVPRGLGVLLTMHFVKLRQRSASRAKAV
ncbi:MAG: SDR family oxidoreductase [Ktedonobacteraceae bacterium]|nr:SDR family oxidoreductase [Ktedonobacteraceae bacterium]